MHGITSWSSIKECEIIDALTISAVQNKDGSFKAWVVSPNGATLEFPRCKIAVKAIQHDPEKDLWTITIPQHDNDPVNSGEMSYEDYENWKVDHGE